MTNLSFNNVGWETSLPFILLQDTMCGSGPVDLGRKLTVRHRALLGVVAATTDKNVGANAHCYSLSPYSVPHTTSYLFTSPPENAS